jgi:hypothetical protein
LAVAVSPSTAFEFDLIPVDPSARQFGPSQGGPAAAQRALLFADTESNLEVNKYYPRNGQLKPPFFRTRPDLSAVCRSPLAEGSSNRPHSKDPPDRWGPKEWTGFWPDCGQEANENEREWAKELSEWFTDWRMMECDWDWHGMGWSH